MRYIFYKKFTNKFIIVYLYRIKMFTFSNMFFVDRIDLKNTINILYLKIIIFLIKDID